MPIFMDRHDIPGVTAKDVAEAHQKDLMIQEDYGCRALTYWFDEEKGMAFCLIEAPDKESVQNLHNYAHGLIPNQIIEVEPNIVESFLGRIEDPVDENGSGSTIINDPAFRSVMVVHLNHKPHSGSSGYPMGRNGFSRDFEKHFNQQLKKHNGLQVEHTSEGFMASFASVKNSVSCAKALQKEFTYKTPSNESHQCLQIGLSAGVPVSGDGVFFGKTVKLAVRLAMLARPGEVLVTSLIDNLARPETLNTGKKEEISISALHPQEEEFVSQIMDIVEANACDADFDVKAFSRQMKMSKSQLYRKLTSVAGCSPNDFIREHRLKIASELIEQRKGNISEIAYESGFNSLSYFSKCFQQRFDVLPSDYASVMA